MKIIKLCELIKSSLPLEDDFVNSLVRNQIATWQKENRKKKEELNEKIRQEALEEKRRQEVKKTRHEF